MKFFNMSSRTSVPVLFGILALALMCSYPASAQESGVKQADEKFVAKSGRRRPDVGRRSFT